MDFKVTPWNVTGRINYSKLMDQFGLRSFDKYKKQFSDSLLFRRGLIFAHRDFSIISDAIKKKKPFVMMTGLMPSGKFHFGHKLVADQIIYYQKLGARIYIAVADIEAYNSRSTDLLKLRRTAIEEYLLNYVSLGLDLDNCDFYFQSMRSNDGKKSNSYYALANLLARHVTLNEFKAVYGDITPGKMVSSLLQSSDMLHPQLKEFEGAPLPVLVPVGSDQDPHIRLTRDILKRIKVHKFTQISSTYHKFMPGLKGGKMSSSDEYSYIALNENSKEASKKILKHAFSGGRATEEEHRKLGGNPDVDMSFQMLRFGLEEDDKILKDIETRYKSGDLLSGELKKLTINRLTKFLESHQKKLIKNRKIVKKYVHTNFGYDF